MIRLVVSCGDPSGVGPQLAAKLLNENPERPWAVDLTGPPELWRSLGVTESKATRFIGDNNAPTTRPGEPCTAGAEIQCRGLIQALEHLEAGQADAIVTLPVNKLQMRAGGIDEAGHTELFRRRYPESELTMVFRSDQRWLGLATDHIPLRRVPEALSPERIASAAEALHRASCKPVALCGLNPHAGEGGMLGDEELRLEPALELLRRAGVPHRGFLPADGLFARWSGLEAILALYHDQGLAPFKAMTANRACQISLGLPFVRTSPDHGTAYELAKSGEGDPGSTRVAFDTAWRLAQAL